MENGPGEARRSSSEHDNERVRRQVRKHRGRSSGGASAQGFGAVIAEPGADRRRSVTDRRRTRRVRGRGGNGNKGCATRTASEVSSRGGTLRARTPARYAPGSAAGDMASLIRSLGDARRSLRLAYGHARGSTTARSIADRQFGQRGNFHACKWRIAELAAGQEPAGEPPAAQAGIPSAAQRGHGSE